MNWRCWFAHSFGPSYHIGSQRVITCTRCTRTFAQRPLHPSPDAAKREQAERLAIVPVRFTDAVDFVRAWHRHHEPPIGHKFSIGVAREGVLVGVAIVGRPVARHFDDGLTLEVTRSCTSERDEARNANSMLYGACWRAAKALGYARLITYTQEGESGVSLRAAGWRVVAERRARPGWTCPSRPREARGTENTQRTLWEAVGGAQ